MSKYETACEFHDKADCEGGIAGLVLGYGVSTDEVPGVVAAAVADLEEAYKALTVAIEAWHGDECTRPGDWGEEYGEYRCAR